MTATIRIDGTAQTIPEARAEARKIHPPDGRWNLVHEDVYPSRTIVAGFWKNTVLDVFMCSLYYEEQQEDAA